MIKNDETLKPSLIKSLRSIDSIITDESKIKFSLLFFCTRRFWYTWNAGKRVIPFTEGGFSIPWGKSRDLARYSRLKNRQPLLNASRRHIRGNWSRPNTISTLHHFPLSIIHYLNKSIRPQFTCATLQRQWARLETASIYAFT